MWLESLTSLTVTEKMSTARRILLYALLATLVVWFVTESEFALGASMGPMPIRTRRPLRKSSSPAVELS